MRQMVGRVLRGVAGGGEAVAHVVDLRDRWDSDVDVVGPEEIPGLPGEVENDDVDPQHVLPPVFDELTGLPIGEDLLRRIEKAYGELRDALQLPHPAALVATTLTGFFELGDLNVPVFEHAREVWDELIAAELARASAPGKGPLDLFDHLPVPRPARTDVAAVVESVRSQEVEPPFVECRSVLSLRSIAEELLAADAMKESDKFAWLKSKYESSLARSAYFSLQAFREAVQQEVDALVDPGIGSQDPEAIRRRRPGAGLPILGKRASRDIKGLFTPTAARGRQLLIELGEADYATRLEQKDLPNCEWTRRPVKSAFAYWSPRISRNNRGKPIIRVNVLLQAAASRVPDEMLEYLLWHELVHHLLPVRGHDAEFRRLESLWPDAARIDSDIDTLEERYDFGWDDEPEGLKPAA